MSNAFSANFDMTHPLLRDLQIFDISKDNVASRLMEAKFKKDVDLTTGAVKVHTENYQAKKHDFEINYKASVNEIEFSTRLNTLFKKALSKAENLEELLRPIEKDY